MTVRVVVRAAGAAGYRWLSELALHGAPLLIQILVLTVLIAVVQHRPGLQFAGASLTGAVTFLSPSAGLLTVLGLALLSGLKWEVSLLVAVTWIAVACGQPWQGRYPRFGAAWTVLVVAVVVGGASFAHGAFREVNVPDMLSAGIASMYLCVAVIEWFSLQSRSPGESVGLSGIMAVAAMLMLAAAGGNLAPPAAGAVAAAAVGFTGGVVGTTDRACAPVLAVGAGLVGILLGVLTSTELVLLLATGLAAGLAAGRIGMMVAITVAFHLTGLLILPDIARTAVAGSLIAAVGAAAIGCVGARSRVLRWPVVTNEGARGRPETGLLTGAVRRLSGAFAPSDWTVDTRARAEDIQSVVCAGCSQIDACGEQQDGVSVVRRALEAGDSEFEEMIGSGLAFCRRSGYLALALIITRRMLNQATAGIARCQRVQSEAASQLAEVARLLEDMSETRIRDPAGRTLDIAVVEQTDRRGTRAGRRLEWRELPGGRAMVVAYVHRSRARVRETTELMTSMLGVGFAPDLVHRAALIGSGSLDGADCDLVVLDLHSGELDIISLGLTHIVLVRKQTLELIRGSTGAESRIVSRSVSAGDTVVAVTAGKIDGEQLLEELASRLESTLTGLARQVAEIGKRHAGRDCHVIAIRLQCRR